MRAFATERTGTDHSSGQWTRRERKAADAASRDVAAENSMNQLGLEPIARQVAGLAGRRLDRLEVVELAREGRARIDGEGRDAGRVRARPLQQLVGRGEPDRDAGPALAPRHDARAEGLAGEERRERVRLGA